MKDPATLGDYPAVARSNGANNGQSGTWTPRSHPGPALFVRLARTSDLIIGLAALVGAFLITNLGRMPQGFGEFLALRLTVKNLVLLAAFALVWRGACTATGLYRWSVVRGRRDEAIRVLLAAGLGGAVALVFAAISVTAATMLLVRRFLHGLITLDADTRRNVLILGTGARALQLGRELSEKSGDR